MLVAVGLDCCDLSNWIIHIREVLQQNVRIKKKKKNQAACWFSENPRKRTQILSTLWLQPVRFLRRWCASVCCKLMSSPALSRAPAAWNTKRKFSFSGKCLILFSLSATEEFPLSLTFSFILSCSQSHCYKLSVLHTTMKPRALPSLHLTNFDPNLSSCHYPSPLAHHLILSSSFDKPFYLSYLIFLLHFVPFVLRLAGSGLCFSPCDLE